MDFSFLQQIFKFLRVAPILVFSKKVSLKQFISIMSVKREKNISCIVVIIYYLEILNFEPSFKLRGCRARDLFGLQIPVTTGGFELRISCIRGSYLTH